LTLFFGSGISTLGCVVDLAEETGVIVRKGAWYNNGDNISQGRDNAIKYLEEKPEVAREVAARASEVGNGSYCSCQPVMTLGNDEDN